MQKTDAELIDEANIIKNESEQGANTAQRVGDMLINIVDSKVNTDSGGGGTLDQVLQNGNTAIDKTIVVSNENETKIAEVDQNHFYVENTQSENTKAATVEAGLVFVNDWVAQKGSYLALDYISIVDNATSTQMLKDRLLYTAGGNGKTMAVIFPVDPIENVQLFMPNASQNSEIALVDSTYSVDLGSQGGLYNMPTDGVYEFLNCTNAIQFPDPTLFNGKKITIVNIDDTNPVTVQGSEAYILGTNTQIDQISQGCIVTFVSISGKWRGGFLTN